MKNSGQQYAAAADAPMLGDHLALDLLNTEARDGGAAVEFWNSGDDVLRWLARYHVVPAAQAGPLDQDALLAQARALRTLARGLIEQRRSGTLALEVSPLNAYLNAYVSAPQLAYGSDGAPVLTRTARGEAIASLLGPVAEAVAQLLVEGNFELVRQCEHPDCVLWFYDRTKAHKRRWCSMALCGNRYKAAQFRARLS